MTKAELMRQLASIADDQEITIRVWARRYALTNVECDSLADGKLCYTMKAGDLLYYVDRDDITKTWVPKDGSSPEWR